MYYPRYFRLGQSISLKRVFLDPGTQNQTDMLSGQIASCDSTEFIIHFPFGKDKSHINYPFFPGMPFEIHSEYHDLGIQVTSNFEDRISPELVRLAATGDLGFYYLREHPRVKNELWLGLVRGGESLLSMRRQWRRDIDRVRKEKNSSVVTAFSKQQIEIGNDGINMEMNAPVQVSELILIYLALDDGKPLICTLAEVVWAKAEINQKQQVGLHFINILDEDQVRINRFIRAA